MSGRRHPADETLAAFAAGSLPSGPRLVVETQIQGCLACRRSVRAFEAIGGALLEEGEPAPLPGGLLARTLAKIEAQAGPDKAPAPEGAAPFEGAPTTLRNCRIGRWRFVQPGARVALVTPRGESRASAMLIRVHAGRNIPHHTHDGVEYTQVLVGSYSDAFGNYAAGDFDENDASVSHEPKAGDDGECICLLAIDGRLRMTSLIVRLVQPFLGL